MAAKLLQERPGSHVLNQFRNASNAVTHYDYTAEEILNACENRLDMVVSSIGTGGTLTGIARKIKEVIPSCKILAVDPVGSTIAVPDSLNHPGVDFYEVEGIGGDFIPTVLDRNLVDIWCKVTDKEAFQMARRLMREEGMLCGGSSGAAMHCALKKIKKLKLSGNNRVVVILPDSIRNYFTKFVNDDWLKARGLMQEQTPKEIAQITWWRKLLVEELKVHAIKTVSGTCKLRDVLKFITDKRPIIAVEMSSSKNVIGTMTAKLALRAVSAGKHDMILAAVANLNFKQISIKDTLSNLSILFQYEENVLVFETKGELERLVGSINSVDLGCFICKINKKKSS